MHVAIWEKEVLGCARWGLRPDTLLKIARKINRSTAIFAKKKINPPGGDILSKNFKGGAYLIPARVFAGCRYRRYGTH